MRNALIISLLFLVPWKGFAKTNPGPNIYIIYYATRDGKTGHVGIAVDTYRILYRQAEKDGKTIEVEDTVATGELNYFDLWPREDEFDVFATVKDIPATYYRLPASSTEEITVNSLMDKGLPHKERYACDGLLKIPASWSQQEMIIQFLDSLIQSGRDFNAQKFNCTDFVRLALERLLHQKIDATEFIFVGRSSTPNKLYRELRKIPSVEVVKNADQLAKGSFLKERILHRNRDVGQQ